MITRKFAHGSLLLFLFATLACGLPVSVSPPSGMRLPRRTQARRRRRMQVLFLLPLQRHPSRPGCHRHGKHARR